MQDVQESSTFNGRLLLLPLNTPPTPKSGYNAYGLKMFPNKSTVGPAVFDIGWKNQLFHDTFVDSFRVSSSKKEVGSWIVAGTNLPTKREGHGTSLSTEKCLSLDILRILYGGFRRPGTAPTHLPRYDFPRSGRVDPTKKREYLNVAKWKSVMPYSKAASSHGPPVLDHPQKSQGTHVPNVPTSFAFVLLKSHVTGRPSSMKMLQTNW